MSILGYMVLLINISGIIIIYSFIFLIFNIKSTSSFSSLSFFIIIPLFIFYKRIDIEINTIDITDYLTIIKEDTILIIILITLLIFFYGFLNILML